MNCVRFSLVALISLGFLGCSSDEEPPSAPDAAGPPDAGVTQPDATVGLPTEFGGDRPAELLVPAGYDAGKPTPLLLSLHGYSPFNAYANAVFGLDPLYDTAGFLLLTPHGTLDADGKYFWNATDACCNFYDDPVDDVAYLNGLVDEVAAVYNVDPKRIFVIGHSNGGFMAYRLACESADRFAAVISVAGASYQDAAACTPSRAVSVLQIHGTDDGTITYTGGNLYHDQTPVPYPGAADSIARWAGYNACSGGMQEAGTPIDLTQDATTETDPSAYAGCPADGAAELWTLNGVDHIIVFKSGAPLWSWLSAHARP